MYDIGGQVNARRIYANRGKVMAYGLAAQTLNLGLSCVGLEESVIDHRGESALRYAWHKVLSKNRPRAYLFKDVERPSEITKHYLISGRVQGVGFRAFTERSARLLGLMGWVRNLEDGRVEAVATGGMDLLQEGFGGRYASAVANQPSAGSIKIGRLYLDGTDPAIDQAIDEELKARGFRVVTLDKRFKEKWVQADKDGKVIALADAWVNDAQYADKKGVTKMTKLVIDQGKMDYNLHYKDALKRKAAWQRDLRQVFTKVDFIAVPTLQSLPPKPPKWESSVAFEWLVFNSQNTVGINFSGNPALAIPIDMPERGKFIPVTSLQLVGRPLSEAELLNAGRLLERKPPTL